MMSFLTENSILSEPGFFKDLVQLPNDQKKRSSLLKPFLWVLLSRNLLLFLIIQSKSHEKLHYNLFLQANDPWLWWKYLIFVQFFNELIVQLKVKLKLKVLFSSVSGKDLTIIEVSETGLTSSVQLYNARRRQSGTEYLFLYLKCDTAGNRTRDLPRLKLTPYPFGHRRGKLPIFKFISAHFVVSTAQSPIAAHLKKNLIWATIRF